MFLRRVPNKYSLFKKILGIKGHPQAFPMLALLFNSGVLGACDFLNVLSSGIKQVFFYIYTYIFFFMRILTIRVPPGLQNARGAERICKSDINICREGHSESIGSYRDPDQQATRPLDGVPLKT
jgi:hypothetical protein